MREIRLWGQKYANITEEVIGYANELYDNYDCYASECALGNFIADAYLHINQRNANENTSIAFVQAGAIRAPISAGRKFIKFVTSMNLDATKFHLFSIPHYFRCLNTAITYGDLKSLLPFEDTVDSFDLSGQDIVDALEHSVGHYISKELRVNKILQVSGE